MKMGKLEKAVVNSDRHSRRLIRWAEGVLQRVPLADKQTLLDVGCGVGILTRYAATHYNLQATGVDIDPEQIAEAQRRSEGIEKVHHLVNDAVRLQFADNTFDIVMTFKALHHVPNWQTAVEEMLRVLQPDGYFVFFDLAAPQWLSRLPLGEFSAISVQALNGLLAEREVQVIDEGHNNGLFYSLVGLNTSHSLDNPVT